MPLPYSIWAQPISLNHLIFLLHSHLQAIDQAFGYETSDEASSFFASRVTRSLLPDMAKLSGKQEGYAGGGFSFNKSDANGKEVQHWVAFSEEEMKELLQGPWLYIATTLWTWQSRSRTRTLAFQHLRTLCSSSSAAPIFATSPTPARAGRSHRHHLLRRRRILVRLPRSQRHHLLERYAALV